MKQRILFYIEPRIDMENAYLREWWLKPFCFDLIKTLQQSKRSNEFEFCIALNEPLKSKNNEIDGVKTKLFTQRELFPPFLGDSINLSVAWYKETYTNLQMTYYVNLMKERLSDFIPDIVITFTPAPFLRKAFPDSLMLYHEAIFFSRKPYPSSLYFDPCGVYFGYSSFLNTYREEIKKIQLTETQSKLLSNFKNKCQTLINKKSPFNEIMKPLKDKYDYLVLLPLGVVRQYAFDATTRLNIYNMYQHLTHILDYVPRNIGVVVTFAPGLYIPFDTDTINFLKKHYHHFIYFEEFEKYDAVSQYLLAYVDGVIGLSTGICFQTLIWDKKLLEMGDSEVITDAFTLKDLEDIFKKKYQSKDNILYWILTRYAIQKTYLHNPEWLSGFLSSSLQKYRSNGITFDFFEPIDSDENIFENLMNGLDEDIPRINSLMSYSRLKKSHEDLKANYESLKSKCDGLNAFQLLDEMVSNGVDLFTQGKQNEANTLFSKMLQGVNNIKSALLNNMAIFHIKNGNLDDAEQIFIALINEGFNIDAVRANLHKLQYLKNNIIQTTSFAGENQK